MNAVAFRLGDAAWRGRYDALFEACPGAFIQQSTRWAEVIAPLGPDTPLFLLALEGDVPLAGMPLYLFEHAMGNLMTSVPQAGPLGGVFLRPGLDPAQAEACYACLIGRALEAARASECLALSVITNPFADDRGLYGRFLEPDYVLENFTQSIDLGGFFAADGSVALADYNRRSNLSRNLARAKAAGLVARVLDSAADVDRLYAVHVKRHAELGAAPLDRRLLENIARVLMPAGNAAFVVVESPEGLASWGVYVRHREVMDVLRLNMDSAFSGLSPNFLNTDASLRLARDLGVRTYNWQSSPSRAGGVYRFKEQWGAKETTYEYATRLLCPPSRVREIGVEALQREYPLHFLAPYLAAQDGFAPGRYRKA